MNIDKRDGFEVIGLSARVRNDEPSGIVALWSQFYKSRLREQLPGTDGSNIYSVYHDYEGDHSAPYIMTIGYSIPAGVACPEGLSCVAIPPQTYAIFETVGAQPEALISQWQTIWQSDLDRTYIADFDTYDAKNKGRVTVSVGVKPQ